MIDRSSLNIHSRIPIERLLKNQAYIGGRWIDADARFRVCCPNSGTGLAQVADLGERGLNHPCEQTNGDWQRLSWEQRRDALSIWIDLVGGCQNALALIRSSEQGSPWQAARSEIATTVAAIEHRLNGAYSHQPTFGEPQIYRENPVFKLNGCAHSPFGFTLNEAIPALMGGQAVVVRPPRQAPLTTLALAAIADQAQLPPGAFNVVP